MVFIREAVFIWVLPGRPMKRITALIMITSLSAIICGQKAKGDNPVFTAYRLSQPLKIDGLLEETLYQAPDFDYFIQEEPDNGSPATEATSVWVGYDDKALYVGARMHDTEPELIVTRMVRRDADFNSDEFQLAIDSYNDNRSGFYFIVNPSGSIQDGTIANDNHFNGNWDGIWDQATRLDDQGWTVEIRIPFSQLRFNQQDEIVMGFACGRQIKRKNEHSLTFSSPRGEPGAASKFGTLVGIRNISPPKRVELTPYLTGNIASLPSEDDNPFYNGRDSDAGFGTDLKIGIGNNLTVDATINPDFGQVEVDPSVINLSAYETFYSEKRPFFVEGASIFDFGSGGPSNRSNFNYAHPNFFYSRRIGRAPQHDLDSEGWIDAPSATKILGAAKISGKLPGDLSIGGLSALTRREIAQVDEDSVEWEGEVEPLSSYNLARIQKELDGGTHGIGGMVTYLQRHFDDRDLRSSLADNALGVGVDGWTFFNDKRNWAISGWGGYTRVNGSKDRLLDIQESYTHYFQKPGVSHVEVDSNLTTLEGWAFRCNLNREKGNIIFNSALGFTSPGYETNDMGIGFRTDQINKHVMLGYRWLEPTDFHRFAVLWGAVMSNHNFGGDKINNMHFLSGNIELPNYYGGWFMFGWGPRTIDDTKLRGGPMVSSSSGYFTEIGIWTDSRKDLSFDIHGNTSAGEIGFWSHEIEFDMHLKLGTRLNMTLNPEYEVSHSEAQYVMALDDPVADYMYGTRYILADIDRRTFETSLRFEYTFTPKLTFQAYLQNLLATGEYSEYKEYARPRSMEFIYYDEEGLEIRYDEPNDEYYVVETDQPVDHEIDNDFNYKSLVGSAVLRWEFRPGSILYVVWTNNAVNEDHPGNFRFDRDISDLWKTEKDNILAVKLTWWLGR